MTNLISRLCRITIAPQEPMAYKFIIFEKDQDVAVLTLNRPEVLNSLHAEMAAEIQDALRHCAESADVRALLIAANGRAFCAGQDLATVAPDSNGKLPLLSEIIRRDYNPTIRLIRQIEKPIVCAVNGIAAGAGANLAIACDIVIAAREASFVQSFSKIGLIPDSGGTFFLPRLVGYGRASALTMLAEKISAEEAERIGMIYRVVDAQDLLTSARELASRLSVMPTRGLGYLKQALNQSAGNSLENQLMLEEKLQHLAGQTEDYAEGVTAFLAKRTPKFKGQ